MEFRQKKLIAACLLCLFTGVSIGWIASSWRFGIPFFLKPKPSIKSMVKKQFSGLDLTPEQSKALEQIHIDTSDFVHQLQSEVRASHDHLDQTILSSRDPKVIRQAFDKVIASHLKREEHHFTMMLKIQSILSMEQLERFQKRRQSHRRGKGKHPPRGPNQGPPPGRP